MIRGLTRCALVLAAALTAGAVAAQEAPEGLAEAPGAVLRGLDKVAGTASDITLAVGQTATFGKITVTLRECRYPADDPSSNAYAYLIIADIGASAPDFAGWMIADSPALSALDHQRYDVWVIRCKID
ncbi:MAG: DUF2155 domain-containing protein [Sphingomonadales bacterium]|nr:DUF2155 domain-containing protein [Sphingomonadales bacterium]